jgi:hypothetical protein
MLRRPTIGAAGVALCREPQGLRNRIRQPGQSGTATTTSVLAVGVRPRRAGIRGWLVSTVPPPTNRAARKHLQRRIPGLDVSTLNVVEHGDLQERFTDLVPGGLLLEGPRSTRSG